MSFAQKLWNKEHLAMETKTFDDFYKFSHKFALLKILPWSMTWQNPKQLLSTFHIYRVARYLSREYFCFKTAFSLIAVVFSVDFKDHQYEIYNGYWTIEELLKIKHLNANNIEYSERVSSVLCLTTNLKKTVIMYQPAHAKPYKNEHVCIRHEASVC